MSDKVRYYILVVDPDSERPLYTLTADVEDEFQAVEWAMSEIKHGEAIGKVGLTLDGHGIDAATIDAVADRPVCREGDASRG